MLVQTKPLMEKKVQIRKPGYSSALARLVRECQAAAANEQKRQNVIRQQQQQSAPRPFAYD
jgi:hypothetical protein